MSPTSNTKQLSSQSDLFRKRLSLFEDKVFTVSEEGEVYRLPKGSTAADYLKLYRPELYQKVFLV
jgi:(p)ppGpp synthase/HD superfamily hydrolase